MYEREYKVILFIGCHAYYSRINKERRVTTINWDDGPGLYIAAECSIHLLLGERYYFCRGS